ncbi:hypothetical protein RHMOL_Rhmol06G0212900 [Rhododendron molle]|uniref:Uncharacterized protein n=1 Tax=Rhododendron molle TaxID=49168 RepID=A0ACC0NFJ3_RHOML|nr:hypothetical protein RHMOL_Rhmol06G0212900 [Rhododendron molle]
MAGVRSLEASSSTSPCSYDVFLSFRGEDTRKSFTDHLYTALDYAGFATSEMMMGLKGEKRSSQKCKKQFKGRGCQ